MTDDFHRATILDDEGDAAKHMSIITSSASVSANNAVIPSLTHGPWEIILMTIKELGP